MRNPEVTYSTMGQGNPAHAAERKNYKFKKDPDWVPNDPRYREGRSEQDIAEGARSGGQATASRRAAERARRIAEFARHRDEGKSVAAAGRLVGVAYKTARTYEHELRALRQQRGENGDA
jgi:hypothetical protein